MAVTSISSVALSLRNIDIVRGSRLLISDLSLDLDTPQILWIEGGNGIGKTSLLRTCAGLSSPAAGRVTWQQDQVALSAPQLVGFLPSDSYAKTGLTAAEDAALWGASDKIAELGLAPHGATRAERLSTGQAKRLSLAKLVAANKPIWIMDEPLAGLDADGRQEVARLLEGHVASGGLALVASHAPIPLTGVKVQRLRLQDA